MFRSEIKPNKSLDSLNKMIIVQIFVQVYLKYLVEVEWAYTLGSMDGEITNKNVIDYEHDYYENA